MSTTQDLYPSRNGRPAQLMERLDPVIYSRPDAPPPVARSVVESYEKNGFVILEDLFTPAEVALLQQESQRLRDSLELAGLEQTITEPDSGEIRSIFKVHGVSALLQRLASDHRLVNLAQYILNDQVYLHQSRLNYKPGFRGREFYWHSDFETWHVEDGMPRMRALSMSITLTENNEHNGALMLVPGSHQHYVVCPGETPENHYQQSLKKQELGVPPDESLRTLVERGGLVPAYGRPGSVIVFDCNTMHGSNSNISPWPRSNLFFVYNALSNRVVEPFCGLAPRPEFIAARQQIEPLTAQPNDLCQWAERSQANQGNTSFQENNQNEHRDSAHRRKDRRHQHEPVSPCP